MLTDRELVEALIVNLKDWNWDINSKFDIDQKTGAALIEIYNRMKADLFIKEMMIMKTPLK